jgi:hypothetical protein
MIGQRRAGRLVPAQGLPGSILYRWEPPVPFVPREFLDGILFLYPSLADAEARTKWGGSGFLFGIPSNAHNYVIHLYAVTNDHVREGAPVVRLVTQSGEVEIHEANATDWIPHPDGDDLAVLSLGAVAERRYIYASPESLITTEDFSEYGVGPGDECMMVGRYINHDGEQFDRPIVRFGNLAMMPERIKQSVRVFEQDSFLVDMRSVWGFSGSPVFVYYENVGPRVPLRKTEKPSLDGLFENDWSGLMSKTWLLGINWGNLPAWTDMIDEHGKKARVRVDSTAACVVPAWKLNDLLAQEEIVKPKDEAERKLAETKDEGAVLDALGEGEFERFENLAREVIRVPKVDINEQKKDRGD